MTCLAREQPGASQCDKHQRDASCAVAATGAALLVAHVMAAYVHVVTKTSWWSTHLQAGQCSNGLDMHCSMQPAGNLIKRPTPANG